MGRTVRNATVALGAGVSTQISEAKWGGKKRIVLEIANLNAAGGDDVFVSIGMEAAASQGRRIQAGQTILWSMDSAYIPPQDTVNGYAAGATNISVYEEVE